MAWIFLSYRRSDKELARSLNLALTAEFGSDAVFHDLDDLGAGDFREQIKRQFENDPVILVLLTDAWHRAARERINESADPVRMEIAEALRRKLTVIPIEYEGAGLPKADDLPNDLKLLPDQQRYSLDQDHWDYDLGKIVKALRAWLNKPARTRRPTKTSPPFQPVRNSPRSGAGLTPAATSTTGFTHGNPLTWSSRFSKSPAEKAKAEAIREAERQAIQRARIDAPGILGMPSWWIAATLTLGACLVATFGSDLLLTLLVSLFSDDFPTPRGKVLALVLLTAVWTVSYVLLGSRPYWRDPRVGPKSFYSWMLGAWALTSWLTVLVGWVIARGLAWVAFQFAGLDYTVMTYILVAIYTVIAGAWLIYNLLGFISDEIGVD